MAQDFRWNLIDRGRGVYEVADGGGNVPYDLEKAPELWTRGIRGKLGATSAVNIVMYSPLWHPECWGGDRDVSGFPNLRMTITTYRSSTLARYCEPESWASSF